MSTVKFKGRIIFNPSGRAGEYSYWAANFYNGCSAMCEYCFNRHGENSEVLGCDVPTIKPELIDEKTAIEIFESELTENIESLQEYGLFFNFVSDPCLRETYELNINAVAICIKNNVPVKILTKQAWWVDEFLSSVLCDETELIKFGFTLTGMDNMEKGASSNQSRIDAMIRLKKAGFKTFASIEPIIDVFRSLEMIESVSDYCDLFKIGLKSGEIYDKRSLIHLFEMAIFYADKSDSKIYFKDSLLSLLELNRDELPSCCVKRDYKL